MSEEMNNIEEMVTDTTIVTETAETTETTEETKATPKMETMEDYANELEASFRKFKEGDIITGTVIGVSEDEVTLDLKYYAPGIIKAGELSDDPSYSIVESIHEGDQIQATVVRLDDGEGNILLSLKEAAEVLAWDTLKELMDKETILTVKIGGIVNAGVIAYVEGIRGFIPASQLALTYVEDLNEWLNKEVEARVITVDESAKKLVLSAKSVARERAKEESNQRISMMVPGMILEGTVESLMPYGAFVNLGNGLSGLVHISQICERRISKPSEVLTAGETVKVKVLETKDNKISLSIKALEENAVAQVFEEYDMPKAESVSTSLGDLLSKFKF